MDFGQLADPSGSHRGSDWLVFVPDPLGRMIDQGFFGVGSSLKSGFFTSISSVEASPGHSYTV